MESIINQTYKDIEIILIDDGSTDNSGELCDEFASQDKRIKVFHNSNKGLLASRQFGYNKAKGDYISFVDSDDYIENNTYERLIEIIENNDNVDIICFSIDTIIDNFHRKFNNYFGEDKVVNGKELLQYSLENKITDSFCDKLFKNKTLKIFEGNELENVSYEDVAYMYKHLSTISKGFVIEDVLYHYSIRNDSITKTITKQNIIDRINGYPNFLGEFVLGG